MHRAICLLFALTVAPALGACCNFDKDTLWQEADTLPGILDMLAGKFERMPAQYHENVLAALDRVTQPEPGIDYALQRAMALAHLGRFKEALAALDASAQARKPEQAAVAEQWRADMLYLAWRTDPKTWAEEVARHVKLLEAENRLPLERLVLAWAERSQEVRANEMLPDYFGLRFASNKTAIENNDQLDTLKLRGVIPWLLDRLQRHAGFENVDTYYALSLALAVDGKQQLAYYARLRVHDLIKAGSTTALPVTEGVNELQPLLYARQLQLGKLVEIRTLDVPQKQVCEDDFAARRKFVLAWQTERDNFLNTRLKAGRLPDEPDFWQGFVPRVYTPNIPQPEVAPPPTLPAAEPGTPAAPASEPQEVSSRWVTGGAAGAGAVVIVMLMHFSRRKRSAPKL